LAREVGRDRQLGPCLSVLLHVTMDPGLACGVDIRLGMYVYVPLV
jgi:hypothetical protein